MRWYVVYTHNKSEHIAERHLRNQGFEIFLPKIKKQRCHARRIDWIRAPLFPRYLFVRLDIQRMRWASISSTLGVSDLITRGKKPLAVPEGVVEEILKRQNNDGIIHLSSSARFSKGDAVKVINGPFTDKIGLVDSMSDDDRIIVLFNLLGRQSKLHFPLETVSACV